MREEKIICLDFCISFIHSFNLLRHIHAHIYVNCLQTAAYAYVYFCFHIFFNWLYGLKIYEKFLLSRNPVILEEQEKKLKNPIKVMKNSFLKKKTRNKIFFLQVSLRHRREGKKSKQNVKLWAIYTTTNAWNNSQRHSLNAWQTLHWPDSRLLLLTHPQMSTNTCVVIAIFTVSSLTHKIPKTERILSNVEAEHSSNVAQTATVSSINTMKRISCEKYHNKYTTHFCSIFPLQLVLVPMFLLLFFGNIHAQCH